jgi:hypothetical protein
VIRLYAYKLTNDGGFAPNPFWGVLTLATCKPQIRLKKRIGDWIGGFTSGTLNGDAVGKERLIFLAQVTDKMTIANYFRAPRFACKKPVPRSANECLRHGDNIYEPLVPLASDARELRQLLNDNHWDGDGRDCGGCKPGPSRKHDVSGRFVLICDTFAYFGAKALVIPKELRPNVPRGQSAHGSQTVDQLRANAFIRFVLGVAGGKKMVCHPWHWPSGSECWKGARRRGKSDIAFAERKRRGRIC